MTSGGTQPLSHLTVVVYNVR